MAIPNDHIKVEVPKWKYDDEDEGYVCDDAEFWFGRLYHFVATATTGTKPHVTLCGAGQKGFFATNSGVLGELVVPRFRGMVGGESGAAFNAGAVLMSDANGRAIAHVAGAGNYVVGRSDAAAIGNGHRVAIEVESYVA